MVYNWEIRHHSLVCCCRLAGILHIFLLYPKENFKHNFPLKDLKNCYDDISLSVQNMREHAARLEVA